MIDILLKGLFTVAVGALVGYACYKIYEKITAKQIKEQAKVEMPEAFRIKITEAERNSIKADVFSRSGEKKSIKLESDKGVSSDIYAGQTLYC